MNKLLLRSPSSNSKGISLIEILLGLAVLVILLSFAMPSASGAAIKAEMSVAVENIQHSIQAARQTARVNEMSIAMNISTDNDTASAQVISFSATHPKKARQVQIQDFNMPPEIMIVSDQASYQFDERGLVENPGAILLVSTVDETVTSTVNVK
ncbi:Tfp pilus assembly protein FimT/FimU [Pseudomonadota bacterium]